MLSAFRSDPFNWISPKWHNKCGKCRQKFISPPFEKYGFHCITSMNIVITREVFVVISCIKINNCAKMYKYSQNLIHTLRIPTAWDIFTEFMLTQQRFVKTSIPNFTAIHQTVWSQVLVHRQMIVWSPDKTFSFTGIKATFYFPINFVGLQGKWVIFTFCCHLCFWHTSCFL